MWQYSNILNEAENVIVANIQAWLGSQGADAYVSAPMFVQLYEDDNMGISRLYPVSLEKIPFIIVQIASTSEKIIGLGGNSIGNSSETILTLTGPKFDVVADPQLILNSKNTGKTRRIFFPPDCFSDPTNVIIDDMLVVMRSQLQQNWYLDHDGTNIYIVARNDVIKVLIGGLGLNTGTYKSDIYDKKFIGLSGDVNIYVGAESELSRKSLSELLGIYIQKLREGEYGFMAALIPSLAKDADGGLILTDPNGNPIGLDPTNKYGYNNNITVFVNSPFRMGSQNETSMGSADNLNLLYTAAISGNIFIEAMPIDEGRILQPVTAIWPFNNAMQQQALQLLAQDTDGGLILTDPDGNPIVLN